MSCATVSLSLRRFLLDRDDILWRLPNTKFDNMLRDPANHGLSAFAGQRVRMAEVVVELANRMPKRIVRSSFAMLPFDHDGHIALAEFTMRQMARAEAALAPALIDVHDGPRTVVDASASFIAQGGQWVPTSTLLIAISDAALGQGQYRRL
jgi:hypothetical protein